MSNQRKQMTVHVSGQLSIELSTNGATTLISSRDAQRAKSGLLSRLFGGFRRAARSSTTVVSTDGSVIVSNSRGVIASGAGTSVVQRVKASGNATVIQHAGDMVVGENITQCVGGTNTGIVSMTGGATIIQDASGDLQISHAGPGKSSYSTIVSVPANTLVIVRGTNTVSVSKAAVHAGISFTRG